jgi:hypothetical protein
VTPRSCPTAVIQLWDSFVLCVNPPHLRHPLRGWYHAQWRAHDGGTLPDDRRELLDRLRFFADRRPTGRPAGPGAQPQPRPRRTW